MRHSHGWRVGFMLFRIAIYAYKGAIERRGATDRCRTGTLGKGIIMNMARSFSNWRKYRQTVNELDRMSTRELQDLGIERAQIKAVARAAVGF